jgi:hypothetical protein
MLRVISQGIQPDQVREESLFGRFTRGVLRHFLACRPSETNRCMSKIQMEGASHDVVYFSLNQRWTETRRRGARNHRPVTCALILPKEVKPDRLTSIPHVGHTLTNKDVEEPGPRYSAEGIRPPTRQPVCQLPIPQCRRASKTVLPAPVRQQSQSQHERPRRPEDRTIQPEPETSAAAAVIGKQAGRREPRAAPPRPTTRNRDPAERRPEHGDRSAESEAATRRFCGLR